MDTKELSYTEMMELIEQVHKRWDCFSYSAAMDFIKLLRSRGFLKTKWF